MWWKKTFQTSKASFRLHAESESEVVQLCPTLCDSIKLNIQKTKIMASSSIISWQIDGENVCSVRFHFLGSKINADSDCSHKIKRRLFLGRIAVSNLDSVLKRRDITLQTKIHIVKAMTFLGFPGDLDGKESTCSTGHPGLIPGSGGSPKEGNGYPLQYSCLENAMDRGAWWATVHGIAKSRTWPSD